MKIRKRFILFIIFLIITPFAWAIWHAFLYDVVPRHRTWFWSYDSFRDKAFLTNLLAPELPESVSDTKYYWSIDRFVDISGYGATMSNKDYEEMKEDAIERYNEETVLYFSGQTLYINSKEDVSIAVTEDWIKECCIEDVENLLLKEENPEDYYILAYEFSRDSEHSNSFSCVLCKDSTDRIIEIYRRNKNVVPGVIDR